MMLITTKCLYCHGPLGECDCGPKMTFYCPRCEQLEAELAAELAAERSRWNNLVEFLKNGGKVFYTEPHGFFVFIEQDGEGHGASTLEKAIKIAADSKANDH